MGTLMGISKRELKVPQVLEVPDPELEGVANLKKRIERF